MAELTDPTTNTPPSACCAAEPQTTCCEPSEKEDCCVPEGATCGCSAGASNQTDIREVVREKYAAAATGTSCCDATPRTTDENGVEVWWAVLYDAESTDAPGPAIAASLGCGVPTAVADLHEGETVLWRRVLGAAGVDPAPTRQIPWPAQVDKRAVGRRPCLG